MKSCKLNDKEEIHTRLARLENDMEWIKRGLATNGILAGVTLAKLLMGGGL